MTTRFKIEDIDLAQFRNDSNRAGLIGQIDGNLPNMYIFSSDGLWNVNDFTRAVFKKGVVDVYRWLISVDPSQVSDKPEDDREIQTEQAGPTRDVEPAKERLVYQDPLDCLTDCIYALASPNSQDARMLVGGITAYLIKSIGLARLQEMLPEVSISTIRGWAAGAPPPLGPRAKTILRLYTDVCFGIEPEKPMEEEKKERKEILNLDRAVIRRFGGLIKSRLHAGDARIGNLIKALTHYVCDNKGISVEELSLDWKDSLHLLDLFYDDNAIKESSTVHSFLRYVYHMYNIEDILPSVEEDPSGTIPYLQHLESLRKFTDLSPEKYAGTPLSEISPFLMGLMKDMLAIHGDQQKVGDILCFDHSTVSKWATGTSSKPHQTTLQRIYNTLLSLARTLPDVA